VTGAAVTGAVARTCSVGHLVGIARQTALSLSCSAAAVENARESKVFLEFLLAEFLKAKRRIAGLRLARMSSSSFSWMAAVSRFCVPGGGRGT
jgi:hypothetical protein